LIELDAQVLTLQVDSVRRSADTYCSEIASFLWYCDIFALDPLSVSEREMIRYVCVHRNSRSAGGYLTAVRWLYDACAAPIQWDGRTLALTIRGLGKSTAPIKRAPPISWDFARGAVRSARLAREFEHSFAYVLSSSFSLRVLSECLPLCFDSPLVHSRVFVERGAGKAVLVVELTSRKTAPQGEVLKRPCICAAGREADPLCPVHAFYQYLSDCRRSGSVGKLFPSLNPTSFQRVLRIHLRRAGFPDADSATTHGFRRGTTQELVRKEGSLADILRSGGWKSSAFIAYLDRCELDCLAIFDMMEEAADEAPPPPPAKRPRERPRTSARCVVGQDIRVLFQKASNNVP